MKNIKETDLYLPVKEYFEGLGYTVRAEVKNCDVAAAKDGQLVVAELKLTFNARLLFQAIDRQKAADMVYIAIPSKTKEISKIKYITQKLNLGLLTVDLKENQVTALTIPESPKRVKNNLRTRAVKKELSGRLADLNQGGSTGKKLITAYTEKCIYAACAIYYEGQISAKRLRDVYGFEKEYRSILSDNYYGWFEKKAKGQYVLSDRGLTEVFGQHGDLFNLYSEIIKKGPN